MVRRQHAQVVTLDFQRAVEARAKILQCDRSRQFDDLFCSEEGLEFFKYRVGNLRRRSGHALGVAQHRPFPTIEKPTGFEDHNLFQLLVADAGVPANGRVDIHSERTPDHLRGPHRRQDFETRLDYIRGVNCPS